MDDLQRDYKKLKKWWERLEDMQRKWIIMLVAIIVIGSLVYFRKYKYAVYLFVGFALIIGFALISGYYIFKK